MLPNFLIIGGMKCGTTSLAAQAGSHPDVFIPEAKELDFFSNDEVWAKGPAWYETCFEPGASCKARGEACTTYAMFPTYPRTGERVAETLPHARLIYIVRDPVARLVSHYLHEWYEGRLDLPLDEAIDRWPELIDYGCYYTQIKRYLPHFAADCWHVVCFEEYVRAPLRILHRLFAFLQVDADYAPSCLDAKNVTEEKLRRPVWMEGLRRTPGLAAVARRLVPRGGRLRLRQFGGRRKGKPELSPRSARRLKERFLPEVRALSEFAGRDFVAAWDFASPTDRVAGG